MIDLQTVASVVFLAFVVPAFLKSLVIHYKVLKMPIMTLYLLFQLRSIPSIGPSGILTSYIGALRSIWRGNEALQEGYEKV